MQPPPISQSEIESRISKHLDELLELWWAEQGVSKPRNLQLIASALPFPQDRTVHVLDLCCGPGDVGRAIRHNFPNARIDCVDRDPFLMSICAGVNRRSKIDGKSVVADLKVQGWQDGLSSDYDVIATVNAIHWFDLTSAEQLVQDVYALLHSRGVFVFAEPVSSEAPFGAGFEARTGRQPPRYSCEAWERFWSCANALLGYDQTKLWGPRPDNNIGDGMTVSGWIRLVEGRGVRAYRRVAAGCRPRDYCRIEALVMKSSSPTEETMRRIWTIIGVADVSKSFSWYQSLLGLPKTDPAHDDFGQIVDSDGTVLLCLHEWGAHGHPPLMSPTLAKPGNGVLLFFRVENFDVTLSAARALVSKLEEEPHVNPNTGTMEFSLRDLDGYYVSISAT